MNRITRLYATLITGVLTALTLPGVAWADDTEVLRRGRGSFFGACGAFCCLFVVGGIVLAVVLITRGRTKNRQLPPQ